jgi:WD40 repeat protein
MRRHCAILFALLLVAASPAGAQPSQPIPPRFESMLKNERFRLVGVMGDPEIGSRQTGAAFSADGNRAVYAEDFSTGNDEKPHLRSRLLVWDIKTKAWPREIYIEDKTVTALALSADGGRALLAGQVLSGKAVKDKKTPGVRAYLSLFDLDSAKEVRTVLTTETHLGSIALSPDALTALTAWSGNVATWDLKDGKQLAVYEGKGVNTARPLCYLPDGKQFLAGYARNSVGTEAGLLRWDLTAKKSIRYPNKLDGRSIRVTHLSVASDGKRFASAIAQWIGPLGSPEDDLIVSLWDTDKAKEINRLRIERRSAFEHVYAVAVAEDGRTVLSVVGPHGYGPDDFAFSRLIAWDGVANKILWSHTVSCRYHVPMLVKDGKLLVGGGPDPFEVWSIMDGKKLESWGAHRSPVNAVAVLPNGDILSAGNEGQVMIWRKGEIVKKLDAHAGSINAIVVNAERKQWLSAGADKTIKFWAFDADKPGHVAKGHTGPITSLAVANKIRWAASGSGDHSVKTWDLGTGKEIATFNGHTDTVNAVAISADGVWIASASNDATIRLWPVKDGKPDPDREVITLEDHKKAVTCLAFSPDGKTLLSGSQDNTMIVWDYANGKALKTLPGHKNWVTSLLFLDAKTVLTTSDDLSVCMWNIETGKEMGRVDLGVVGDCPRSLARLGDDRILVGSSGWLIYEMQLAPKTK